MKKIKKGSKPVLTEEQIDSMKNLLGYTSCALDNLFVGLQEHPTGIHDCQECFTKSDIKSIEKAFGVIRKAREEFDGSRKQRRN